MNKFKSKSEKKREAIMKDEPVENACKDEPKEEKGKKVKAKKSEENVKLADVKYRVTFLTDQMFIGLFRPKGTAMEVPASIAKAYGKRTSLKFEPLS